MISKKSILISLLIAMIVGVSLGAYLIYSVYGANVSMDSEEKIITINKGDSFDHIKICFLIPTLLRAKQVLVLSLS